MPDEENVIRQMDEHHPMTVLLRNVLDTYPTTCKTFGVNVWGFLSVLANVQGLILAHQEDMTDGERFKRAEQLNKIITSRILNRKNNLDG